MDALFETDYARTGGSSGEEGPLESVPRRYRRAVCRYFEVLGAGSADAFFLWLRGREFNLDLGSVRQNVRGFLLAYGESVLGIGRGPVPEATDAFEAAWRQGVLDRAVEAAKARFLAERRIVPFLAYERAVTRGPADHGWLAEQMGLSEGEVRAYIDEVRARVEAEARLERDADGEGASPA